MARQTALIKISGDLVNSQEVIQWIKEISQEFFTVICIGGGTQINEAFINSGIAIGTHGPLGRETNTFLERQLARDILESNQSDLQDALSEQNISASVIIPTLDIGTVLCHVNGDIFILSAYHGYNKLYIVTTKERVDTKELEFAKYPKISIKGF
jgi:acetylglutamate kinase